MWKILPTWRREEQFEGRGFVAEGTDILYGNKPYRKRATAAQHRALVRHFDDATAEIGTSFDNPPTGSVGEWLQANVTKTAMASYVGPILLGEGHPERVTGARSRIWSK